MSRLHGIVFALTGLIAASTASRAESDADSASAAAVPTVPTMEPVIWDETPIEVTLALGRERQLQFPETLIDFEVRPHVKAGSKITRTKNGQTVNWRPKQSFEDETAIATTVSGRVYQLSVTTRSEAPKGPLRVLDPGLTELVDVAPRFDQVADESGLSDASALPESAPEQAAAVTLPAPPRYSYVELARYAAQHFSGPERLIRELPGITSVPVTSRPVRLLRFTHIDARPVKAWTDGELYVTAVSLENRSTLPVDLDPSHFRGQWRFIAPHIQAAHRLRQQGALSPLTRLLPNGSLADEGYCYLISDRPFGRAL